jgi:UDP-GlcNAc:undecaprenyl-phosphate GlcNAc-1-phosphate transferase
MIPLALHFLVSLAAALILTPVCRRAAVQLGFVAKPQEDRWHKKPTALFGGVAIALPVLVIALTLSPDRSLWQLVAAGAAIAAFGLVDDIMSLKPSTKLIVQITVASFLLFYGWRAHVTQSMIGDAMLTLVWIVSITNAFNLLDNMDGLCAGTALIAAGFLLIGIVSDGGVTTLSLYLASLMGATLGFLVYNMNPASIFMGDAGSLFLGLNMAAITLIAAPSSSGRSGLLTVVAAPVFPLLIPIFDTALVTALRLLSGRAPSQGGRDHTSHRLVAVGLSEKRAVATLWALAAAGGVISVLLQQRVQGWGVIAATTFILALGIFGVYLARVRVYEDADLAVLKGESLTPLIGNFMYKRRVAEILLDSCLITIAYYSAYRLRFEGDDLALNYPLFIQSLPVVLAAQLVALFIVGGYRGTWRYFGMMDAVVFAKGVLLGTASALIGILFVYRFDNYSRTVFVVDALLLLLLLAGSRASFRLLGEFVLRRRVSGRRCVIYGTGGASLSTIREAFGSHVALKIVGFVEDDPLHRNIRVGGYSVVGDSAHLVSMIRSGTVDCVVLNTHLVDVDRLRELESACRAHDVELLRLSVDLKPVKPISAAS